jgi:5-methylcytosine-specific restriction endonuclease McrA
MTREEIKKQVLAKTQGRCWYCGNKLSPQWEHDHSIPRSRGGAFHPDNLVPCCRGCNKSKNARTSNEFKRYTKNKILQSIPTTAAVFKRFPNAFSEADQMRIQVALESLHAAVSGATITWHGERDKAVAA